MSFIIINPGRASKRDADSEEESEEETQKKKRAAGWYCFNGIFT